MSSDVRIIHPPPPPADEETIQEVLRELDTIKTETPSATASTPEYYQKKKDGSYAIDARHTTRGRALIITMTADRKGWKADVKKLQKIFISLDIDTEYIFDPDSSTLYKALCDFAEDDKNDEVDCSFVVFMGHGFADGNNTYLQTMDERFDIFGTCKLIFSNNSSKLKEKPKLIIAQMCRKEKNIPADDAIALNRSQTKTFQHYILLLSCNPGEFSNRDEEYGSWYIQHLARMMEKSHNHHVEKIVKQISKLFDEKNKENPTKVQVPQQLTSLTQKINMFPGIMESHEEEQNPAGIPNEVVNENASGGENVDSQNDELCPKLTMRITPKTKPEEAVNTVTNELVDEIKRDDGTKLGDYYSEQLGTQLRMNQIFVGSINIDWCISDLSELEEIKSMSDTGILSNLSTYFLVKPQLLKKCAVDKIFLKTEIDPGSYEKLRKYAEDKNKVVNSLLRQTQDISSLEKETVRIVSHLKGDGQAKWYKDNQEIKDGDNIRIETAEGKSTVVIQHCRSEHNGMYRCVSEDGARKFIHDQYLYVDDEESFVADIIEKECAQIRDLWNQSWMMFIFQHPLKETSTAIINCEDAYEDCISKLTVDSLLGFHLPDGIRLQQRFLIWALEHDIRRVQQLWVNAGHYVDEGLLEDALSKLTECGLHLGDITDNCPKKLLNDYLQFDIFVSIKRKRTDIIVKRDGKVTFLNEAWVKLKECMELLNIEQAEIMMEKCFFAYLDILKAYKWKIPPDLPLESGIGLKIRLKKAYIMINKAVRGTTDSRQVAPHISKLCGKVIESTLDPVLCHEAAAILIQAVELGGVCTNTSKIIRSSMKKFSASMEVKNQLRIVEEKIKEHKKKMLEKEKAHNDKIKMIRRATLEENFQNLVSSWKEATSKEFSQDADELLSLVKQCLEAHKIITVEEEYSEKVEAILKDSERKYLEQLVPHLLFEQGRWDDVIKACEDYTVEFHSSPKIYLLKAKAHAKRGDINGAKAAANQVKKIDTHYKKQAIALKQELQYRGSDWYQGNMEYIRPKLHEKKVKEKHLEESDSREELKERHREESDSTEEYEFDETDNEDEPFEATLSKEPKKKGNSDTSSGYSTATGLSSSTGYSSVDEDVQQSKDLNELSVEKTDAEMRGNEEDESDIEWQLVPPGKGKARKELRHRRNIHEKESGRVMMSYQRKLDNLNNKYETRVACDRCCPRKGLNWEMKNYDHTCLVKHQILIAKIREETKNQWDKVRRCQAPNYKYAFRICRFFQGDKHNCKRKEDCSFAHSKTEIDFWNLQRNFRKFDFKELLSCGKINPLNILVSTVCSPSKEPSAPVHMPMSYVERPKVKLPICKSCNITCESQADFQLHLNSTSHRQMERADTKVEWKYRPPPNGIGYNELKLCDGLTSDKECHLGDNCVQAHSKDELLEWKEHVSSIHSKYQKEENKLAKQLLKEIEEKPLYTEIIRGYLKGVKITCAQPRDVSKEDKDADYTWMFHVECEGGEQELKHVMLLEDKHREEFFLLDKQGHMVQELRGDSCLEASQKKSGNEYQIQVYFMAGCYGTFHQKVIFDFGSRPVVAQDLAIDVATEDMIETLTDVRKSICTDIWTNFGYEIKRYTGQGSTSTKEDEMYKQTYPLPDLAQIVNEKLFNKASLTHENYVDIMHQFLFLEEQHNSMLISKFNWTGEAYLVDTYFPESGGLYKYPHQLFAELKLQKEISSDSIEGNIILRDCTYVNICIKRSKTIFQSLICKKYNIGFEGTGSNNLVLLLSQECVDTLNLKHADKIEVEVQFVLDRLEFCKMHFGLDKLNEHVGTYLVVPEQSPARISGAEQYQVKSHGLTLDQKKIVEHIVTDVQPCSPPLLFYGPFGTGKTATIAWATLQLVKAKQDTRVLICTQSNSAADLYIEQYFHSDNAPKILRLYYKYRDPRTVSTICKIYTQSDSEGFKKPDKDDIIDHQIIISTLATSMMLLACGGQGLFTHIFIDEAGQALETQCLVPLSLATEKTCVVLAGDYQQMSPVVYSDLARQKGFHQSLLQRLLNYYNQNKFENSHIFLTYNFRSHVNVIKFVAEIFYGGSENLHANSKDCICWDIPALAFYESKSMEIQLFGSTGYCNIDEAIRVAEEIEELRNYWPSEWGQFNEQEIGVVSAYQDQILLIRKELRARDLRNVYVRHVMDVQGLEFRALFISTVRTMPQTREHIEGNLGFLSDPKLLNTALTRVKSHVAVVGHARTLCNVGSCQKIWVRYLEYCRNLLQQKKHHVLTKLHPGLHSEEADQVLLHFARKAQTEKHHISVPSEEVSVELIKIKEETSGYVTTEMKQPTHSQQTQVQRKWKEYTPSDALEYLQAQPDIYKRGVLHLDSFSAYIKIVPGFEYFEQGKSMGIFVTEVHLLRRTRGYTGRAFGGDDVVVEITHMASETGKVYGSVVAVMEQSFNRFERYFMCMVDKECEDVGLLIPINPAFPKIRLVTDKMNIASGEVSLYQLTEGKVKFKRNEPVDIQTARTSMFKVQYLQWREDCYNPLGIAVDVFRNVCDSQEAGLQVLNIEYNVPSSYTADFISTLEYNIPAYATTDRRDLRAEYIFTIDSEGTNNFDDAISVQKEEKGMFRIGVHISDITGYIPEGGVIDKEAYRRAVSRYFIGRQGERQVVHMLPETLSTDHCSFLPGKDRLALTLMLIMNDKGTLLDVEMPYRSVITCKKSLTYKQAQELIRLNSTDDTGISGKLNILRSLTTKYRLNNIGNQHYSPDTENLDFPESHAIVQELMIITNAEIAKFLTGKNNKCSGKFDCVPVRRMLPPSDIDVKHWMKEHEQIARHAFGLRRLFGEEKDVCNCIGKCQCRHKHSSDTSTAEIKYMSVLQSTWQTIADTNKVLQTTNSKELFGNLNNFPKQTLALIDMNNMKKHASYTCNGSAGRHELGHHDLKLDIYTHFTSPTRRYIDIVVQRLVISMIEGKGSAYTPEQVDEICHHCTLETRNAVDFERETTRLNKAFQLKQSASNVNALIHRVTDRGVKMHYYCDKYCDPANKILELKYMNLAKKPTVAELEQTLFMTWEVRSYDAMKKIKDLDKVETKHLDPDRWTRRIPIEKWQTMLCFMQREDYDALEQLVHKTDKIMTHDEGQRKYLKDVTSEVGKGKIIKHYQGCQLTVRPESIVSLQISSQVQRGLLTPRIQLFRLTPTVDICVEHLKEAINCFSELTANRASRGEYRNAEIYRNCWIPAISMEAAYQAIKEPDSATILNVPITWNMNGTRGQFELRKKFCAERFLLLFSYHEESSAMGDYLCIRYNSSADSATPTWVAHCIVDKLTHEDDESHIPKGKHQVYSKVGIAFDVHRNGQHPPEQLLGQTKLCTVEWIPCPLPMSRMMNSMKRIDEASTLACGIAFDPKSIKGAAAGADADSKESAFLLAVREANKKQQQALNLALQSPFTLIQGPPGTGKTETGARLACLFVQRNNNDPATGKRSSKVMYCGPSNKSVDVVAEKLKRIPKHCRPRMLRVYGTMVEHKDFPIPREPVHSKHEESTTESKSRENLRDITLHFRIREKANPMSERIGEFDERFRQSPEEVSEEEMREYIRTVTDASLFELEHTDIILCTCVAASAPKFTNCYIKQVIIDECGMCTEPESMVAITAAAGVQQVVLIGDHKQLQPVINARPAIKLGLNVSLFERCFDHYRDTAAWTVLETQYRMHEGIMAFPSQQFYRGMLKCGNPEQQRTELPCWPGGSKRPIVFCNLQGYERSLAVSAAEGGLDSKSNLDEVDYVVRYIEAFVHVYGVPPGNIAALSFYRSQCTEIVKHLSKEKHHLVKTVADKENVVTVVKSQGSEWDYVVLSCVRSLRPEEIEDNPTSSWSRKFLGIVADPHQINVAITRAKKGLVIIGNKKLLEKNAVWRNLIQHYEQNNCLKEARDFLDAGRL